MQYDPRTIAFCVELLHPPMQHDLKKLQGLHGDLFADNKSSYKNFNLIPGGATFSNPQANASAVSLTSFLQDRIQIREELSGASLDDTCSRVEKIAVLAVERFKIPLFTGQQCIVRSLINPRQFRDSREFLARALFRFTEDDLKTLGRPLQLLGLRLVFPRVQSQNEVYALRLESYNGDPRALFLENIGTFSPVLPAQGTEPLLANLRETYRFLTEEVLQFLGRFDRLEEKK